MWFARPGRSPAIAPSSAGGGGGAGPGLGAAPAPPPPALSRLCAGASAGMEDAADSLSFVSLNSFVMDD